MRRRSKVKLCLIPSEAARRTTFMKRRKGIMKKLNELTSLCDVKACAIIRSPYQVVPDVWPSPQGVQEVVSNFMEFPVAERTKLMKSQETYLMERINKGQKKLNKLVHENRELHLQQFMFDCFKGKMSEYQYDATDVQDLQVFIDEYLDKLHHRIEVVTGIHQSTSLHHDHLPVGVAGIDPFVTQNPHFNVDAAAVTTPVGFYGHIQYQNMNQNQQEPVQHHVSPDFDCHIQYQNMIHNQQVPVQQHVSTDFDCLMHYQNQMEMNPYQIPNHVYNHIQHGMYQNMNLGSHQNVNHYINQQESLRNQMVDHPQQMGYVGEHSNMSFMVNNHYNNYQVPSTDFSTTSQMSFSSINNNNNL